MPFYRGEVGVIELKSNLGVRVYWCWEELYGCNFVEKASSCG